MGKKIKFVKNPNIHRENYENKTEYNFVKETDVVPSKKNRLLCVFFSEDRGCYFLYRKMTFRSNEKEVDYFRFRKGQYMIDNESIHIANNGCRVAFYLEGISTPIKMSNIDKETVIITYLDLYGNKQKSTVQKIKGLKFDAKILDVFANRRFADLFTRQTINNWQFFLLLIGIASIVLLCLNVAVSYFY